MKQNKKIHKIANLAAVTALCLALVFASAGLNVSAHKDGGCLGDVPATSTTIVVDGQKDAAYNDGLKVEIKYPKTEEQSVGATGAATLLCTDGFLYVFFEVTDEGQVFDPIADNQQNRPWLTESCEVFINEKNSDNEQDVVQYRVDWTGWPSLYTKTGTAKYGSSKVGNAFGYAAARSTTGYKVEFRIPLKTAGQNVLSGTSSEIGIHFQINDVKDEDANLNWATEFSAATGSGSDSWQVEAHPYVTLGASGTAPVSTDPGEEPAEAPTEEPTEAPTDAPTDEPTEEPTAEPTDAPTEEPATEAPVENTEEPADTETPTDEPSDTAEPASEEPAETAEPSVTDGPSATDEPAATEGQSEPPAQEPTEKPKDKKGCGNTVGGAAASLILTAAAAFAVLKAKKKY